MVIALWICVAVLFVALVRSQARCRSLGRGKVPAAVPQSSGLCQCTHAKSFHEAGKGKCRDLDMTRKYAHPSMNGGSPPCKCQLYVPKDHPPATLPAGPPGNADPAWTKYLELLKDDPDWLEHLGSPGEKPPS